VSFFKAMYGDTAKKENDWAFHYLPKIDRNYGIGPLPFRALFPSLRLEHPSGDGRSMIPIS
jgi:hypothetical protein